MKLFVWFTFFLTSLASIWAEEFPVQEVVEMAAKDREIRIKWIRMPDLETAKELRIQERENTARLKEIVARYGLPSGYETVTHDPEGRIILDNPISATYQLVLHSSDLDFQKYFLEKALAASDLWSDESDELTDRILLRQGLPQRYGSHLYHKEGAFVCYPVENPEKVDELRSEMGEPILVEYIEMIQKLDSAIKQNNDTNLGTLFFDIVHGLIKKEGECLYYATFDPDGAPSEEEGGFFAFENPADAVAYATCKAKPELIAPFYEKGTQEISEHLLTIISPQNEEDLAFLSSTPLFVHLVPKEGFTPHYESIFLNRLFLSNEKIKSVNQAECNSVLEALILSGSSVQVAGTEMEINIQSLIKDRFLNSLYFDITLENEIF